ncbi:MAG: hypothetical protein IT350_06190 [Deltaproteobacteria bacterium]|nr:hypothetical protein [Deltaproteobacteria bacterium]
MRNLIYLLIVAAAAGGIWAGVRAMTAPRGVPSTDMDAIDPTRDPVQGAADSDSTWSFAWNGGQVVATNVASYRIDAKICGTQKYSKGSGWQAQVAPIDVCLMWGDLAVQELRGKVEFEQDMRWTHFRTAPGSPFTPNYVMTHAANTHVIAASDNVRRAVARLREGQVVRLDGHLVDLHGTHDGREIFWKSSRARDDDGAGACEVFLVQGVRVGDVVYE